ncbi:MAG: Hsp70 family protein [Desulfococcaceae bacterium]
MSLIVGIDLGTTNSEIARIRDGRPEIIPVDGEPTMPSCVGLDSEGRIQVGRVAKNQMAAAPENTILSIKRKMGENTTVPLGDQTLSPEEISALILGKLKAAAEEFAGEPVAEAVITVPAYFDDARRKATRNAGTLAGLEVRRIINEPTAAALAYETDQTRNETILVYDLGGGTFDASLVSVENGVVEVKASHGDTRLGGDDFDRLLMEHVEARFREDNEVALLEDPAAANRLWAAVETAKRALSDEPFARIREEYISGDLHLDLEISRAEYEAMIRPLLRKTLDSVHRCLTDAEILPGDVDKVILVGGASRTPLVAEMLKREIPAEPRHEIDPDLIVAMGAAIQAGALRGEKISSILVDITPYTFGTRALGGPSGPFREEVFIPIIRRGTALPARKGEAFGTVIDGQDMVDVRIYQGEEPRPEDNIFIGNFLIEGLSDVPAGNEIVMTLALDINGILEVTAMEKRTGLSKTVTMETTEGVAAFDMEEARERLAGAMGAEPPGPPGSGSSGGNAPAVIVARELRKRAEPLLEEIDPTDAEEVRGLLADSERAIADEDMDKLAELNESLTDMLFYLED